MDVAAEVGMLCLDTQRVIKFTSGELKAGMDAAPSEFMLGGRTADGPFQAPWAG